MAGTQRNVKEVMYAMEVLAKVVDLIADLLTCEGRCARKAQELSYGYNLLECGHRTERGTSDVSMSGGYMSGS